MRKLILLALIILTTQLSQAQYKTVVLDYEKSFFNEGQPLPAESYFIIQGEVPAGVDIVGATIYASSDMNKALHKALWKRAADNEGTTFQVPITYHLRSNTDYSVRINYYKSIDAESSRQFQEQLHTYLDAYLDQVITIERNRVRLTEPVPRIVENLNKIVERASAYYNNKSNIDFPGFSDLVTKSLQNMRNQDLRTGRFTIFRRRTESKQEIKTEYAQQKITSLKELVKSEVNMVANTDLLTVVNSKTITNYPTERLKRPLTVNIGYGAVYFSGNINNLSYGSAPYAGVSFPLGNETFTSKILSRTSISAGVFLTNFTNAEGQTLTGPVVQRPLYLGLGYPVFEFVRINAGVTALQNRAEAPDGINLQAVSIRPFVGLSIDINLWLGLGGRNKLQ